MGEYRADIRLYTPVLQRVIVLIAVVIAVPVALWTITAFIRSSFAPPRAPVYHPAAVSQPDLSPAAAPADPSPPPTAPAAPSADSSNCLRTNSLEVQ